MRRQRVRHALGILGLTVLASAVAYGQNPFSPSEPILVNSAHAYPVVELPPGSAFVPATYNLNSMLDQLAHSSTGSVRLSAGDYSILVRLHCMGIYAAGTQHGLAYRLAPLEGNRAPVLVALQSRAPAAHVPFQQLQELVWQIMGGLSYSELPSQSQLLIDQLIPEYRNRINEDFVTALQRTSGGFGALLTQIPGLGRKANAGSQELNTLTQRYQQIQQTLRQNANNFQAMAHQFVNVIDGKAANRGPTAWSRLTQRVYARLTGGNVYGETANIEIRVLPGSDLADVPLQTMLAYPEASTMQALGWVPEPESGNSSPVVTAEQQTQSVPPASQNVPGGPYITSVSALYPLRMQKIAIQGTGFGTADPFNGANGYLMFVNLTHGNNNTSYWQAGCPVYVCGTGGLSVYVTKWTPTEIDVEGFPQNYGTGTFGMCDCVFRPGDQIQILLANPQMLGAIKQPPAAPYGFPAAAQGAPFDTFTVTVSPWTNPVSIDSISSIQAAQRQRIVIHGSGFGTHEPFNGTSPFLGIKDVTADNWLAGFDGTMALIVSKWSPNEIVVEGFGRGYGGNQALHNGDVAAISVANPQLIGVVNNPQSEFQGAPGTTKLVTVGVAGSPSATTSPRSGP